MVLKEGKVFAVGALVAMFLAVGNVAYMFFKSEVSVGIISGNSIRDVVSGFYETSSVNQRIFILSQFLLLILIVIVILIVIKKFKSKKKLFRKDFVKNGRNGSKTDLDILYEMLKKEKEIGISDIGKTFKVDPDVSLEWSKVLEDGNLGIIDYPRFGRPVLRLVEDDKEGEKGKEEKGEGIKKENKGEKKVVPQKKISKREEKKMRKKEEKAKKRAEKEAKKREEREKKEAEEKAEEDKKKAEKEKKAAKKKAEKVAKRISKKRRKETKRISKNMGKGKARMKKEEIAKVEEDIKREEEKMKKREEDIKREEEKMRRKEEEISKRPKKVKKKKK